MLKTFFNTKQIVKNNGEKYENGYINLTIFVITLNMNELKSQLKGRLHFKKCKQMGPVRGTH